ncbi:MAG: hypothetical protein ACE15B_10510 [Bryobacteraceae bacterium]
MPALHVAQCGVLLFSLALPAAAADGRTCFSITVDSRFWIPGMNISEEHRYEASFRPPAAGDLVIQNVDRSPGCSFANIEPGDSRRYFLSAATGSGIGRRDNETRSAILNGVPEISRQVYATFRRTERGGVLEIPVHSPADPPDSDFFGVCPSNEWQPAAEFVFREEELQKASTVQKTLRLKLAPADGSCAGTANVTLNATQKLDEEMVLETEESYNSWLPAPAQEDMPGVRFSPSTKIRITARIQPKQGGEEARKDRIDFVLEEVTKHKGRCGNFPQNGSAKDDLRFSGEQPDGIVVEGNKAYTKEKVTEASVYIEATDFGAWGRIRASAPELSLKALYKAANTYSVTIPRDDDNNKIADAWERPRKAAGDANADDETVAGQDRKGDGLTLFDEYRGLVVLEGGEKVHKRLDPQVKEIFVIDPDAIFNTEIWLQASGVTAHKIDESMIAGGADGEESRVVNFNAEGRKKYAIRVVAMPGAEDPADPGGTNSSMGYTECGECRMPKDADVCRVFPARIRAKIEDLFRWLSAAVAGPGPEAQELAGFGFPPWLPKQALQNLQNPAAREALVRQMQTQIAIHEVGHAVSLKDHDRGSPKGAEDAVRECPMYYPKEITYQRFIILQTLFRGGAPMPMRYARFCRGLAGLQQQGFNCHARINVKDW